MEIALAALADYASISRDGKLSVMGIFNGVATNELPAKVSSAYLVITLELEAAEAEREHTIEIKCMDADGATAFALSGKFTAPSSRPGELLKMDQILRMENLLFKRGGDYSISIVCEGCLGSHRQAGGRRRCLVSAESKDVSYYVSLPYGERVTQESLDDGSSYYVARVVELEGCTSHGDTADEALLNLQDAKSLYIRTMIEDGLTPPVPDTQGVQATWFLGAGYVTVTCSPAYAAAEYEPALSNAPAARETFATPATSAAQWRVQPLLPV